MNSKQVAYALDFASFLIQKIKNKEEIQNIILFGSVAREESSRQSDIDLFIDVVKEKPQLEREINQHLTDFLNSVKCKHYWKLLNLSQELKLTVGELNKWKELKPSIVSNGIQIYGKFKSKITGGKHQTFLVWENIHPNSKRVLFNKQLFGYRQKTKFYPGLLQKHSGERLGKGCIIVPSEHHILFLKHFRKYQINVKIRKVQSYPE